MVITKIDRQRKNSKRVSLFIDNEFACGLYEDTLAKYGLQKNDEITKATLDEITHFDEYLYAKKVSLDFLSYRLRSIKEIKDKLKLKKISQKTIERTISHLTELGLLNDEEFARQLILSNIGSKPKGKNIIRQKLYQKGIKKEISEKVLDEVFDSINEKDFVVQVFKKYIGKIKRFGDDMTIKRKAFSYLARKGFDFEIINQVIHENLK